MFKQLQKTSFFYLIIDLFLILFIFFSSYLFRHNSLSNLAVGLYLPNLREYSFIFMLWLIFLIISLKARGLYITDRALTIPREMARVALSVLYAGTLIAAVIFFAQYKFFSRAVFLSSFLMLCIFLSGWRLLKRLVVRKLISEGFHNVNVLIVGAGRAGRSVLEEIKRKPYWGFRVVGFLDDNKSGIIDDKPVLGKLSNCVEIAKRYFVDEVIVTIPSERKSVSEFIKQAKDMSIGLKIVPDNFEEPLEFLSVAYLGIIPLLSYKERRRHPAEFAMKRLFDFTVSLILTILLSPLFIIMGLLVKLSSPGPVFYVQKRTGYRGNAFNFYKFRSMVKEADSLKAHLADKNESKGNIIFKLKNDPRVTRLGRFLRKHSLDEIAQLLNVLKGDMSLVGPRPFPVEESQKLEYNLMQRLAIRPGVTGLAQIRGRSNLSIYRWVKWDLWYINNWSFWLDVVILWKTIPVILKGEGAY